MPASNDNSKCCSKPGDNPMAQAARSRRLSATTGALPNAR